MKIEVANAGTLTNFEVLDFLRSRGASNDPMRDVRAAVSSTELKVFDYLVESVACNQTKEHINEFMEKCEKYNLAKAEILGIINLRPSLPVEAYMIIEECETRMGDNVEELLEIVSEVLPPPPSNEIKEVNPNVEQMERIDDSKEQNPNDEQMEEIDDTKEENQNEEKMEGLDNTN